jgi:hypothetical protein
MGLDRFGWTDTLPRELARSVMDRDELQRRLTNPVVVNGSAVAMLVGIDEVERWGGDRWDLAADSGPVPCVDDSGAKARSQHRGVKGGKPLEDLSSPASGGGEVVRTRPGPTIGLFREKKGEAGRSGEDLGDGGPRADRGPRAHADPPCRPGREPERGGVSMRKAARSRPGRRGVLRGRGAPRGGAQESAEPPLNRSGVLAGERSRRIPRRSGLGASSGERAPPPR